MINDLRAGKIRYLKTAYGVSRLERIALLPVGVDEGWTVDEKIDLTLTRGRELARSFGLSERKPCFPEGGSATSAGTRLLTDRSAMRWRLRKKPGLFMGRY